MACRKSLVTYIVLSSVLAAASLGSIAPATAGGGYNSMDVKSVYYDNANDRANETAMLAGVSHSATVAVNRRNGVQRHDDKIDRDSVRNLRGDSLTADNSALRR
jgi:hypothetical protein